MYSIHKNCNFREQLYTEKRNGENTYGKLYRVRIKKYFAKNQQRQDPTSDEQKKNLKK